MSKAMLSRGISNPTRFYCSSGGNAGLACVTAAISLSCPATIVVPLSTSELIIKKLKDLGSEVVQKGQHWVEADTYLREELLGKDKAGVYVPPFDHPDVWEGNASLIAELEEQLSGGYDALVCSVGGGGLFCGIMEGLKNYGHMIQDCAQEVKVLVVETQGADSLSLSLQKGELSRLPAITSIATSLGSTRVAMQAYQWAQRPEVTSLVLKDAEAAMACVRFADEERILVESACGVSLAPMYNGKLREELYPGISDADFKMKNVVVVICGGSNVTLNMLEGYKKTYGGEV